MNRNRDRIPPRPTFLHENLAGRLIETRNGRASADIDQQAVEEYVLDVVHEIAANTEYARRALDKARIRRSRFDIPALSRLLERGDATEYRVEEIIDAQVGLILFTLLAELPGAVLRQLAIDTKRGEPRRGDAKVPQEIVDHYFAAARRLVAGKTGRRQLDDYWYLALHHQALQDRFEREGHRAPVHRATEVLAERAGVGHEAMARRVERAKKRVREKAAKMSQSVQPGAASQRPRN